MHLSSTTRKASECLDISILESTPLIDFERGADRFWKTWLSSRLEGDEDVLLGLGGRHVAAIGVDRQVEGLDLVDVIFALERYDSDLHTG